MELLLAVVAGVLYATGLYLMLRRRLAQLIIGLGLLSNGSNILILSAAGRDAGQAAAHHRSAHDGRSVRGSRSAVADPHGDRHRLRRARLCPGPGSPCPPVRRLGRHRHDRIRPARLSDKPDRA